MPFADIGDAKLYYEIYGNELSLKEDGIEVKPTLLVYHGGPGIDHTFEVEYSRECAAFAQVIFVDHRGNGRSSGDNPAEWNFKQWAKDIFAFSECLGLKKPFVQGVSAGGWIAMRFAMDYPGYARGIILLDTEAYVDLECICRNYEKRAGKAASELARKFFQKERPSPEVIAEYFETCLPLCSNNPIPNAYFKRAIIKPEVGAQVQEERASFNYMAELSKITDPVLYLSNTTNPSHPFEVAQKTAKAMLNADLKFISFENCGIVQLDAKSASLKEIEKFISKYS